MKIFSTWTGVLVVVLLAAAMVAVAYIQYAQHRAPSALASAAGLVLIAVLLARRIWRRK